MRLSRILLACFSIYAAAAQVPASKDDERSAFEAGFYAGLAIDTFATAELKKTVNPESNQGIQERAIAGIDFGYRLFEGKGQQLWILGETVHGMRSASVKCSDNPNFPACLKPSSLTGLATLPANQLDQFVYLVRNATSLEGFMALRYEFLTLNPGSDNAARLYFKAQAGFLAVPDTAGSAAALHRIGMGAIATKGKYELSYLEVGWGRNDLVAARRRNRAKVDAYLNRKLNSFLSLFAQVAVDTDLGYGADSIQSYIGLNVRLPDNFPSGLFKK